MSRIARRVRSRLVLLYWVPSMALVAFRHFDGNHRTDGYLMGDAMVLGLMALAGILCRALRNLQRDPAGAAVRREAAQLLLRALEAMPEQPEEGHSRLRAVPAPASPSSTSADAESALPPGA